MTRFVWRGPSGAWWAAGVLVSILATVWLVRVAVAEVAFEASLRWRVPEIEKQQQLHSETLLRLTSQEQRLDPAVVERLVKALERLEKEQAEREGKR